MKTEKRNLLILILSIFLIIVLAAVFYFTQRISMNPEGTIGNTAGNINNGGVFCEYNGTVYFSNKSDGGSLYAMSADETDVRRLNTQKVGNLLAGGKYLYYFQTGTAVSGSGFGQIEGLKSFNRCDLKGGNSVGLTTDIVVTAQLVNNYLYLLVAENEGPLFYKMKIDKSEKVELADYNINPACAVNGNIYYNGTQRDHYLYSLNTATDTVSEIWRGNLWYPVIEGDYVYYMDVANDYRLCRYSLSQDVIQVLTEDRVDCFNIGNGYIYYQKNDSVSPQLKCMFTDGSNVQVIAAGNYTAIHMTSRYVYFQAFGDDTTMYHAPIGSVAYSVFAPIAE